MNKFFILCFGFVAYLGLIGCASQRCPSSVKLSFSSDSTMVKIGINGKPPEQMLTLVVTNHLMKMRLVYGDVVMLERPQTTAPLATKYMIEWLTKFCEANRVALYVHQSLAVTNGIFSVPLYHWVAPYEKPRSMTNASFYLEGRLLGKGTVGFNSLLKSIERSRDPMVLILGCSHNSDRGHAPWESFDSAHGYLAKALDAALSTSGTKLLAPSDLNY